MTRTHEPVTTGIPAALTLALVACFSVGQLGANLAPFLVEAFEKHAATTPSIAGYLMSAEFGGLLLATLIFWRRGASWSLATTAKLGILAYTIGALATAMLTDVIWLGVARTLCGLGSGAAIAAANASAASQASFDTAINRSIAGATLVAFVLFNVVPFVLAEHGSTALFLTLAACGGLLLIPAHRLSRGARAQPTSEVAATAPVSGRPVAWVVALMLGALLTRLNDSVSWSFNARYAESAGVDAQTLGLFLGVLTLACTAAPYVGSALCRRYGHLPTFVAIAVVKAVATIGLYLATDLVAFALSQAVLFFTFVIVVQLLASALCAEDRSGRLPALAVLPLMLGDVFGPSLAGISYESDGLAGVTTAACAAAIAAAIVLVIAIALRKAAPSAQAQAETVS